MKRLLLIILFILPTTLLGQSDFFKPTDSLTITFNNYINEIARNADRNIIKEAKEAFKTISKHISFENNKQMLCKGLNYLYDNSTNILNFTNFIHTFEAFIESDFSEQEGNVFINSFINNPLNNKILLKWKELFSNNYISINGQTKWQVKNTNDIHITTDDGTTPFINFNKGNLLCPLYDSIIIYNCSGKINFMTQELEAKGGKIDWQKCNIASNQVYALLPEHYIIDLNKVNIKIEKVKLYHKKFFADKFIYGTINDRCVQGATHETSRYPKFNPDENLELNIKNIYPNISYQGSFAIEGRNMIGTKVNNHDAQIKIYHQQVMMAQISAQRFNINDDNFHANYASIIILSQKDTISHPRAKVRYSQAKRELSIYRDPDKNGAPPINSSCHKLKIYCDKMIWNITKETIKFTASITFNKESRAFFESNNYFSENRFRQFETSDGKNSITSVLKYSQKTGKLKFHLTDFVKFTQKSIEQEKTSLLLMSNFELIDYDQETDSIFIRKKLFQYIKNYQARRDYDLISIYSTVNDSINGTIDTKTDLLTIYGIDKITISEKDNVIIYPKHKSVTIKEEMNIEFAGYLQAGMVDLYVQSAALDYHRFKIDLHKVDSIFFFIHSKQIGADGRAVLEKINTPISDLKGYININYPYNKSGQLKHPEFPKFVCNENAYIYYDKKSICNGAYDKERFYFKLDNFSMDSLNTFTPTNLSLEGELNSANIFPTLRYPLTIMPDNSLGFEYKLPTSGLPIYNNSGQFYNMVTLSNKGFIGSGQLDYLTAQLKSEKFFFFPDTATTTVDRIIIQESTTNNKFPYVEGASSEMLWDTKNNEMTFNTISGEPYKMYHDLISLKGELSYSPQEMGGNGTLINGQGHINSNNYHFNADSFYADTTDFVYYLPGNKFSSLEARNYKLNMDVKNKSGDFINNDNNSYIEFKENDFRANFDMFSWKVDKDFIVMGKDNDSTNFNNLNDLELILDKPIEGTLVKSTNKNNEGLEFYAHSGKFDCLSSYLTLGGVNYIEVCDAAIFPKDKQIKISAGGAIMPVINGFAIISLQHKYHKLYNVSAEIKSKNSFKGSGYYDYQDNKGNKNVLFVETLTGNSETVLGRAIIAELSPLAINDAIDFKGSITMTNHKLALDFKGDYNLKQRCFSNNSWVKLNAESNPNNLVLPVTPEMISSENNKIVNGFIFSNPGAIIYPAFMTEKQKIPDIAMFRIFGELSFTDTHYIIKDTSDTENNKPTQYLSLDLESCKMNGTGVFNMIENPGRTQFNSAGSFEYNTLNTDLNMNITAFWNFYFNEEALSIFKTDIETTGKETTISSNYDIDLKNIINDPIYQKELENLKHYENKLINLELENSTIALSDVQLQWDNEQKLFYSTAPFTIKTIAGSPINKTVNGRFIISKEGGTESIVLFITCNSEGRQVEYFFMFHNNSLFCYSNNEIFSEIISSASTKSRRLKRYKDLLPYQYIIAQTDMFLKYRQAFGRE